MGTDNDWERWGARDAYFGVLSNDKFRKDRLDQAAKAEFFASGNKHVERVQKLILENFRQEFRPDTTLDFGCGVGRLTLPLAKISQRAVGIDISPSMITEAAENAKSANVLNVSFALSDGCLSNVEGQFSLVHSYLVLQHIPWIRGRKILQQLANKVEPGGLLAVHFFTSSNAPLYIRAVVRLRYAIPPLNWLRNLVKRRPIFEPAMQLHIYDVDKIICDLQGRGFETLACCSEPDMDGFKSILLLARQAAG